MDPFSLHAWDDVTPIKQDDGPNPLAPIAYAADYVQAMDYYRALAKVEEISQRALDLTSYIIEMNPAHYTIWIYREKLLFSLGKDLSEELDYIDEFAEENPKCYQLWHHRQAVVDKLGDPSRELNFVNGILAEDSKNYHAWSYRQWINIRFALWDQELSDIDSLLTSDVRNNSAWNQRYFVLTNRPNKLSLETIEAEIAYTISKIRLAPHNESPWVFLRGIIDYTGYDGSQVILDLCQELKDSQSPYMFGALVDVCEKKARVGDKPSLDLAVATCEKLAKHFDIIRKNFWLYKKEQLLSIAC
ncbi:farnesyl transferase in complex with biphenyl inhibitor [Basidiobolus meristosporus CBS 931.73]|uniref:Protein farnesyltransferase/geranylgeranyltransferase type-1 subunit alpha n=1 Tax=Basidiobolus meristosporus CBS 931.73 TaxID=1314790 RepID=A0A1Y1Y0E0_9FUNG|nr:farnesyl transferase in complex with biphenyl inhibitor [Basidiobolus meristosporus CBS 931.73]|eukprot:ORX91365.1 farnesyl transferase in complex with biphenyl inhibitor [Basidiobolus meristosporus CBS 931.73]